MRKATKDELLDRELAFHIDEATAAHMARGIPPAQARRLALIELGGREQVRQRVREVHAWAWFEWLRFNLRSAFRFARAAPSFAFAVIATLALGIGANTAVFSAVDSILLRQLPFPHGEQLVRLRQRDSKVKAPETFVSTQRLEDLNRLNTTFQAISGYYTGDATLLTANAPEKVGVAFVAPRFLDVWGTAPALGRGFLPGEHLFHGPNAVLVSNRLWRTHLQADPQIVGKPLQQASWSSTVTGVMGAAFVAPDPEIDLWEPNPVNAPYTQDRSSDWFTVIGRLKPGVTPQEAQADLARVQADLGRQYPATDAGLSWQVQPLKASLTDGVQASLWLLYGAVSLLLLLACTNIAALLMARTAEREHEIAIRFALGAGRAAIVSQLLFEVFALVVAGAALGLVLASGMGRLLAAFSKNLPRLSEVALNWRLFAYALVCSVAVTVLCGLLPALRSTRHTLSGSLAQAGRSQVSTRRQGQWLLVGVQVSLAVALLIASGLLLRSFAALGSVDPGFESAHVLTLRVGATWGETADMGKLTARVNRTLEAVRSVPGVLAAATSGSIPGNSQDFPAELKIVEGPQNTGNRVSADLHYISSGYFETMRIPLLLGQGCQYGLSFDTAVVNRSFAERYLGGPAAVGRHLQPSAAFMHAAEVRGIVGDAREQGANVAAEPVVYWCFNAPTPDPNYLVRVQGNPAAMAEAVRRSIHGVEPSRPVFAVMPLDAHLDDRLAEDRLRTVLLSAFAATAIALVGLGLYGTVSYIGRTRRREVGLRLALGAMPGQIVRSFVRQGMWVTLGGISAGLLLGAAVSRLFAAMLYNTSPLDPPTYASVVLLTVAVTTAATLPPAVRAVRVSPTETLREQ